MHIWPWAKTIIFTIRIEIKIILIPKYILIFCSQMVILIFCKMFWDMSTIQPKKKNIIYLCLIPLFWRPDMYWDEMVYCVISYILSYHRYSTHWLAKQYSVDWVCQTNRKSRLSNLFLQTGLKSGTVQNMVR